MASKLVCTKDKILAIKTIKERQNADDDTGVEKVLYFYDDGELVLPKNCVEVRPGSYTVRNPDGSFTMRSFTFNRHHKIKGVWHKVGTATLTPAEFAEEMK